jgi:type IX secretion system PorP/SprF family membrane protein
MKRSFFIGIALFAGILLFPAKTSAQQDAQYTQYMYNMNILNPAYAGSKAGTLSVSLLGRTQWVGVPGAPQTATLSLHSPITDRMGLGLSVLADKLGPVNEQFVFADYSYTIPVGYYDNLSFGIKAGVSMLNASLIDLQTVFQDDVNFDQNIGNLQPNFGFGAFYYSDIYYVGLSVPNLLKTTYLEKESGIVTDISKKSHIFLTGGYVFDLTYEWQFKPSIMAKATMGTPLSVDLSANFLYDETYEVGASYRWDDSVSLLLNARVTDNLRIGYSYDFTTTEISKFTSGSHELIILFDLLTTYDILSPRFF